MNQTNETSQPVARFKAGAIQVAIWENQVNNQGQQTTVLKASVERRYKDAHGAWASSNRYGRNDIPLVIYALKCAFSHIIEQENARTRESNGSPPPAA